MAKKQITDIRIAVVGLGYVGLPLAVAFAKKNLPVLGFDINEKRITELRKNIDLSEEIAADDLMSVTIAYTTNPQDLKKANFIIIAVPTPVNIANQPDLTLVEETSAQVGANLTMGSIVVYESTVYPGATEEVCLPILEKSSGLKGGRDFFIGYSPERVNPGDQEHTVEKIIKIVSGQDAKTAKKIAKVYSLICEAGIHQASSIKIAEAAKVIENTQRDLNIGLMNELAILFSRLNIDTTEVLEAAGTKWNFLKFRPGLVGGHCIGVDPYYLVYKAESVGIHPQVILAGRQVNDFMAEFVADQVIKGLIKASKTIQKAKILVMGLTFKENIRDIRNSRIKDTIKRLTDLGAMVYGFDPNLTAQEIRTFRVVPRKKLDGKFAAVIISVPHRQFIGQAEKVCQLLIPKGVIMDIPSIYHDTLKNKKNIIYRNL